MLLGNIELQARNCLCVYGIACACIARKSCKPSALAHWLKEAPQKTDQRTPTLRLNLCLGAAAPVRLHSLRIGIQHPSLTLLSNGLQVGVGLNDGPAVALRVDGTSVGEGSCQNFMRSASVCKLFARDHRQRTTQAWQRARSEATHGIRCRSPRANQHTMRGHRRSRECRSGTRSLRGGTSISSSHQVHLPPSIPSSLLSPSRLPPIVPCRSGHSPARTRLALAAACGWKPGVQHSYCGPEASATAGAACARICPQPAPRGVPVLTRRACGRFAMQHA